MRVKSILVFGLLLALAGFFPNSAVGQQVAAPMDDVTELEKSLESNLNWNLENALLLYYPMKQFVVRANVEVQTVARRQILPRLPDVYLSKDVKNLPGLPYLPGEISNQQNTGAPGRKPQPEEQARSFRIKRVTVSVLVDREFSQDDLAFIRRLVTLVADLSPRRGDQVRIEPMAFPQPVQETTEQNEQEDATKAVIPSPPEPEPKRAGWQWGPYVFAAGTAVLLLLLFLWGMRMLLKNWHQPGPEAREKQAQPQPEATPERAGATDMHADPEAQTAAELLQLKTDATDAIVGTPALAGKIIREWADKEGTAGMQNAAVVFAATTPNLIDLLTPYLSVDLAADLRLTVNDLEQKASPADQMQALKKFDRALRRMALRAQKQDDATDALSFLHQMSDDQILHLIKPLKIGVKAIVLAQLRPERAAELLQRLDKQEKTRVLSAMASISRLSSDVYQNIARQLAARARDLEKMRFVRADGVESLVEVLEYMDDVTQEETLAHLETQDMQLAQRVRSRFMTFQDVLDLPADKLRQMALAVDRQMLATSLVQVEDEAVERIMRALPEKLGEMVRADLDANRNAPPKDVEAARRQVLRSIRTGLRQQTVESGTD